MIYLEKQSDVVILAQSSFCEEDFADSFDKWEMQSLN